MNEKQRPRWLQVLIALGKATAYLFLFLGWQMLVSTTYSASIAAELMMTSPMMDYDVLYNTLYELMLTKTVDISLLSGLLTLASLTLLFRLRRKALEDELWIRPVSRPLFGWCAGLAFCLYWLVTVVLSVLPASWMEGYLEASAGLDYIGVMPFLAVAVVAPVVEEVIFRGLILTRLGRAMPGRLAVVLSAVIFGLCHGQLVWFCYAFVLGLVFGYVTYSTGSILPAMLMHVVFNAVNELMLLTGDWEPGVVGWVVIFIVAFAGTAFCVFRGRKILRFVAEPAAGTERTGRPEEKVVFASLPTETPPCQLEQPSGVTWDADSGPNHKFPPQRR